MQQQKSVLGKGLASLLPGAGMPQAQQQNTNTVASDSSSQRHMGISMANLDDIKVNPYQPRREFDQKALQELADSIRANGIIQPLVVRKTESGFELIAGERRMRAAKLVGLKQAPVVIRKSTDKESLELAILENIQRENLNCVEEAQAYFRLMHEFSLTQEQIAEKLGKERASVANYLRLLKLPEAVLLDLKTGALSFGHGKVILGLEDHDQRLVLRNKIITEGLSVRGAEAALLEMKAQPNALETVDTQATEAEAKQESKIALRLKQVSLELSQKLGLKVEIKGNSRRGKITAQYATPEELERFLENVHNTKA